jgi:long-chain acyl-CoA synthetase
MELTPSWHAAETPDAPAVIMGSTGEITTYAELEDRSSRFARALRTRGVGAGDHIAVLMENNGPFLEVLWAAQRSGLHFTAINSHLREAEVQYVLDDCGAVALVSSASMADIVSGLDLERIAVRVSAVGDLPGFEPYAEVLAGAEPGPL